jgi:hypothetical protein
VLAVPAPTAAWTSKRFGRLLATTASEIGRDFRFANEAEGHGFGARAPSDPIRRRARAGAGVTRSRR